MSTTGQASKGFTAEERAAMKERARGGGRRDAGRAEGEEDLLAKIAEMQGPDRTMAERLHAIVKATAPALCRGPGMGCRRMQRTTRLSASSRARRSSSRRYATLGFNDKANLDAGNMWPTAFALKELTPAEETKISALVKKAVS